MAAAVADFRPAQAAAHKIKKNGDTPVVELARTPDILLEVATQKRGDGAACASWSVLPRRRRTCWRMRSRSWSARAWRLIVANDVAATDAGFAVDTNRVTLLADDGSRETLPLMSKAEVAEQVVARVAARLVG